MIFPKICFCLKSHDATDDEKQIRKYNIETGQDEIVAEMNTLNIRVINNIVHGEEGYSFNGNGLAENTGKGQQTHGLYGQVDNQGNVKEIIFDYNSSEVFTYNGGLIIKNVINPLENPITINEVRSLCSVNLENEVLNMEDNKWIMKYTSVVSENGKYILFSDLNNIKDKDTTTFIIYDIKENKCIYKKDIQKHKNVVMQNINISEKYNGFIYSYFEEGIRKAYFYKF